MSGIDQFTKLMLHMDGTNGSTTFTDSEFTPKTITANGNAQISTAQSVFGGASGSFDGINSYLSAASSSDFGPDTGDFTIDGRFYTTDNTALQCIYSTGTGVSDRFELFYNGSGFQFQVTITSQQAACTATVTISNNTWYHFAMVNSSGNLIFFLDGTSVALTFLQNPSGNNLSTSNLALNIGRRGWNNDIFLKGFLDEYRYSRGIARWTSNFTPPTAAYSSGSPSYRTLMGAGV